MNQEIDKNSRYNISMIARDRSWFENKTGEIVFTFRGLQHKKIRVYMTKSGLLVRVWYLMTNMVVKEWVTTEFKINGKFTNKINISISYSRLLSDSELLDIVVKTHCQFRVTKTSVILENLEGQ